MTDSICPPQGPEANRWVHRKIMGCNKFEYASDYSHSLDRCATMEKKIEEMGLLEKWAIELYHIVVKRMHPEEDLSFGGPLVAWPRDIIIGARVTPYERVKAAWKVMNG